MSLEAALVGVRADIRAALEAALAGEEVSWQAAVVLSDARGVDLHALTLVADALRARQSGGDVTYVVNRNINFTNVCVKTCRFCAFSRELKSDEGYFLPNEEVVRRAVEARDHGATEVCVQAGLAPTTDGRHYIELCQAIHKAAPELHIHAFSPEEVKYGATRARMPIREYLGQLKEAGLGSLPGTSAEILDDTLRARLAPGRITTSEWVEVIRTAHGLGIPTTSTMMYGHIEDAGHRARHMALLRDIQRDTGGFTEFVPLSFVHTDAPMWRDGTVADVRPGPTGEDVVRVHAIARIMLGASFRNVQASWVKDGLRMGQWLLSCGVNDLGGTLMNESISTAAGAAHGQLVAPAELRRVIRAAGRVPVERTTTYGVRRRFDAQPAPDEACGEVGPEAADGRFGSYDALVADPRYRWRWEPARRGAAASGPPVTTSE